jgi:hypothetical protein
MEFVAVFGCWLRVLAGPSQRLATHFGQCNPDRSVSGLGALQ